MYALLLCVYKNLEDISIAIDINIVFRNDIPKIAITDKNIVKTKHNPT